MVNRSFLLLLVSCVLVASPLWAGKQFPAGPQEITVPNQLLVGLKPGANILSVLNSVAPQAIAAPISAHLNSYVLTLPPGILNAVTLTLAGHPLVNYVEPNRIRQVNLAAPNDPNLSSQWALTNINAVAAWNYIPDQYLTAATAGTGRVKVAVLDTGADCTHPDFVNVGGSSTDSALGGQFLFAASQALIPTTVPSPVCPWQDDHGHGTHTAGTIAAATGNGVGVASVGYALQLIVYKVLDSTGSGPDSLIAAAIEDATDAGAQVISMSLGGAGYSQTMQSAIDYAWQHNTLVVAAAGNTGDNSLFYPGAANHALGVAATDSTNARASFSTFGNWVKIAGPGVSVLSTAPTYPNTLGILNYAYLSGTSMATPHIAGVAGLVALANPGISIAAIAQRIQESAQSPNPGWDQYIGYGVVNAAGAVSGALRGATEGSLTGQVVDNTNTPVSGVTVSANGLTYSTASDGLFRIPNLPAGDYTLTATGGLPSVSMQAEVSNGADTMLTVQMGVSTGEFTGQVTSNGLPVANAVVEAVASGLITATANTDVNGSYALYIPAGTYNLTASAPGAVDATVTGQALAAGGTATVDIAISTLGMITGVVKDSSGVLVAGAHIDVANAAFTAGATSDTNGNFATLGLPAGSYTVAASAAGYSPTSLNNVAVIPNNSTSVTLVFVLPPPVISAVSAGSVTGSAATITWTTNRPATSQVNYGLTTAYGSSTPLNGALVTSHSVSLTGLASATIYHYQVTSTDAQGLTSTSGDFSFTTASGSAQTLLQLHADASEVSGVTNGSTVTPAVAPAGFSGRVVVTGAGSVNYTPAETGNGVYFLSCCGNTNNAYYKFTGGSIGSIFTSTQGQITYYLKSRYSWAQRQASATGSRYAFDARDGNGVHQLYFFTQPVSGRLAFSYSLWGSTQYYYVPAGTEDALYGSGVILKVTLAWAGGTGKFYLNDNLLKTFSYTPATPNWSAASNFDVGAYEYQTYGGYDSSDDVIDEFTVVGPPSGTDTTPPTVTMTAPASGAVVGGTITVSANATDNVAMGSVQFKLDGSNLGSAVTGAGPSYSVSWNTTGLSGGHTLTALATDAAGNSTTSNPVTVTVDNTPPTVTMTAPASGAVVGGTIAVSANAADNVGMGSVQFKLDGSSLGSAVTGAGPSYSISWNTTGVSGSHTLTALATDTAGNTTTSSPVTITVDNTPPAVAVTAPASGATVSGTITVSANATDNLAMRSVQFQLDGANLGSLVSGGGPAYSISWNTTGSTNAGHTLTAIATDTAGNTTTSASLPVTVNNAVAPPVISSVAATPTSTGATITWTTSTPADSQVAYGPSSTYGSLSPLNSALVTSHSVTLTGLSPSSTYHYQVLSRDAQGNLASSADFTFTTTAGGSSPTLQIHADASEVTGVTNGSVITPGVAPPGFTGVVVANGTGSVNYTPAESGNGVYFLNCCGNTNNAYYKFSGTAIGSVFSTAQGQITFYLKSRYSWAQRQAGAASPRYAFDVRDGNGTHLLYFFTEPVSGRLAFSCSLWGSVQYYYAPAGTEDALYGSGVILQVTLSWNGGTGKLYLNGALMKSFTYTTPAPNWSAASNFDLGAYNYQSFGGYDVSDDVIDEFTVLPNGM